ncbi:hypothetical protein HDU98_000605 [Podochytrium sp. JEL0797]|nr:hypothetical protein HDU98_000605 [Podochytrium sp. JEL0797]
MTKTLAVPKLIVFDLDGTLWWPEMYMLWGSGGPPFSADSASGDVLCADKTKVFLLGDTRRILQLLLHDDAFSQTKLGISSCTDEPKWAQKCLSLMEVEKGVSVKSRFHFECISKDSKRSHFVRLNKMSNIGYEDMVFFDNERGRCAEVAPLGVTVVHCPDGLTMEVWNKGLAAWRKSRLQ